MMNKERKKKRNMRKRKIIESKAKQSLYDVLQGQKNTNTNTQGKGRRAKERTAKPEPYMAFNKTTERERQTHTEEEGANHLLSHALPSPFNLLSCPLTPRNQRDEEQKTRGSI